MPLRQRTGYKVALGITSLVVVFLVIPLLAIVFLGRSAERTPGDGITVDPSDGSYRDAIGNEYEVEPEGEVTDGVTALDDGWIRFSHTDGLFTIELPDVPESNQVSLQGPMTDSMEVGSWMAFGDGGEIVSLSAVPMPPELMAEMADDPEGATKEMLAGASASSGFDFDPGTRLEVDGHLALRTTADIGAPTPSEFLFVVLDEGLLTVFVAGDGPGTTDVTERVFGSITVP